MIAETHAVSLFARGLMLMREYRSEASPTDGKTFIFLSNGKLVSLPAQVVLSIQRKKHLLLWENDKQYRLTVF